MLGPGDDDEERQWSDRMGVDTHPFDTATALQVVGDDMFVGRTSDDYWNFTGPFGGATAATLLRAAMEHPRRFGTPLSFTANFCAPVTKGDFRIAVREIRSNRSTQHWYMELVQADTGIAATATAVFAQRRASWAHQTVQMPHASRIRSAHALADAGHDGLDAALRLSFPQ